MLRLTCLHASNAPPPNLVSYLPSCLTCIALFASHECSQDFSSKRKGTLSSGTKRFFQHVGKNYPFKNYLLFTFSRIPDYVLKAFLMETESVLIRHCKYIYVFGSLRSLDVFAWFNFNQLFMLHR